MCTYFHVRPSGVHQWHVKQLQGHKCPTSYSLGWQIDMHVHGLQSAAVPMHQHSIGVSDHINTPNRFKYKVSIHMAGRRSINV